MKQNTTYKQTELGLIPEDWEVKKLGEILKEYSLGGNYENNSEESGIPLIKMGNIGRGKIDLSKIEYLPKNVNYSKNDILKYNDILFNTRNTLDLVGKVSIWKNEALFALYNSNLLRLYFKEDFVENNDYVNFQFNSEITLANLKKYATGTTSVAAIYTKDLLKLKFLLPPLPEQKKIADCLSTWDVAIEKQSQLIELLTQRKKALMQQLLTGKKRLPGFSEDWKEVKLGEISLKKSSTLQANSIEENKGIYNVYGANGIIANIDFFSENEKYIGIVKDGSGVGNLMLCDANSSVLGTLDIIKNNHKTNLIFLFLILSKINFKKFTVGGAIPHIYYKDYSKEKIHIPSLSEQTAIAEILATADRELQLQKEKLAQLQTQKKGLMQVLLTGKKRLIN